MAGLTLRDLRRKRQLTQAALALKGRMEQTTISALECGKVSDPRLSTIQSLSKALRVPPRSVLQALRETVRQHDILEGRRPPDSSFP